MIAVLFIPFALPALLLALVAAVPIAARWLRVAQREHYVPGSTTFMAWLWVRREPLTGPVALVAAGATVAAALSPYSWLQVMALVAIVLTALLPWGMPVRGTSKKLAFTPRLVRLAVLWAVLHLALGILALFVLGTAGPALVLLLSAPLTDLALAIMAPIEKAASRRFVVAAQKRLAQVRPRVVAITGSYGKTSTKNYVAHLLSGTFATVASPASFNNRLGLSRAVNDKLVPGTEVFVAEMGIFGPGRSASSRRTSRPRSRRSPSSARRTCSACGRPMSSSAPRPRSPSARRPSCCRSTTRASLATPSCARRRASGSSPSAACPAPMPMSCSIRARRPVTLQRAPPRSSSAAVQNRHLLPSRARAMRSMSPSRRASPTPRGCPWP